MIAPTCVFIPKTFAELQREKLKQVCKRLRIRVEAVTEMNNGCVE